MAKNDSIKISALILAKNEENMISDCLSQLKFADEIIVLDQQSSDNTVKIAQKYTKKIIKTQIDDFAKNRDVLKKSAKNEWILYIDADERLEKQANIEIFNAIKNSKHSAYYFPRKNIILGKWLRYGGWWPDYVPRLFKKSNLIGWEGRVHESPRVEGSSGYFKSPLTHLTAPNISHMFNKSINWAKIEAELNFKANKPRVNILKLIYSTFREFFSRYFLKLGFLDGTAGLIEAIYQGYHTAMVLVYLWELQNNTFQKYKDEDSG